MHRALNFAPERAEPRIGAVDILDDVDARTVSGADIFVISEPPRLLFGGRKAGCGDRADGRGSRIADDRRQIRERTHQRLGRVADQAAFWCYDLQRVADGGGVISRQRFEQCSRQRRSGGIGHGRSLQIFRPAKFLKAAGLSAYTRQARDRQKRNTVLREPARTSFMSGIYNVTPAARRALAAQFSRAGRLSCSGSAAGEGNGGAGFDGAAAAGATAGAAALRSWSRYDFHPAGRLSR